MRFERCDVTQVTQLTMAGTESGRPAFIAACRAGFWPCPHARTCPNITSETSSGVTFVLSRTALMTAEPSS